ncbi:hypothetical protein F8S09_14900 [Deinococcus sp. SDU3-2]|uniref:Uncharacterized protein n=1 Tax=Deinococcus terrestris TaxID=2651870 RepID=A0A7X1TSK5_9DEIO|nr:hypothetical protein [Deinococcus terrestris]MPY67948.1 hypothetical protein [Deinococcus terrestris]
MRPQVLPPPNPYQTLFERLEATGALRNFTRAVVAQCRPDPARPPRYTREELQNRVKGTDRWGDVDQHCADVGDLHGFDAVFVNTGIAGHPQMLTLVHDELDVIMTVHKTRSPGQVKGAPNYVRRLIRDAQNRLLYVGDELEDLTMAQNLEGKTFVQLTYGFRRGDRLKQVPAWVTFGVPDGSATQFFFQRDLLSLYPEFGRAEEDIDLNAGQPSRRFTTRPARKEGSETE